MVSKSIIVSLYKSDELNASTFDTIRFSYTKRTWHFKENQPCNSRPNPSHATLENNDSELCQV